jgi:hypothetical protein
MNDRPPHEDEQRDRSALLEETLGFNLRSVSTLVDLWARPRAVMNAVIARDRVTYTPMVRLFLALIGLQVAVSVIWGGYGGLMARGLENMPAEQLATFTQIVPRPLDEFIAIFGNIAAVLHAPLVAGATALSVLVLGAFGERRSFAVNLNLVFAVLTAGSVVGLILLCLLTVNDLNPALNTLLIVAAYFITWLRGMPDAIARTTLGRIVKALTLSVVMMALVFIGAAIMQLIAFTGAMFWP